MRALTSCSVVLPRVISEYEFGEILNQVARQFGGEGEKTEEQVRKREAEIHGPVRNYLLKHGVFIIDEEKKFGAALATTPPIFVEEGEMDFDPEDENQNLAELEVLRTASSLIYRSRSCGRSVRVLS